MYLFYKIRFFTLVFLFCLLAILIMTASVLVSPAFSYVSMDRYINMSLEELMNIKITSVSKSEQAFYDAAAAIFVITSEEIRRSGATSIPETLRIVPGIEVSRMDTNKWAITSRGFNGRYANKLLVMIDGRSVYTPLYSGVYWDVQDIMLEDIDRIEVIRGPGSTVWGENAVNGVINIITKKAEETQGVLLSGGAGNQERGFGSMRYGGRAGNLAFRFYGKSFYRASQPYGKLAHEHSKGMLESGEDGSDEWSLTQGGFRAEWNVPNKHAITIQGDLYSGYSWSTVDLSGIGRGYPDDKANMSGGNMMLTWKYSMAEEMDFTFKAYYYRTDREQVEYKYSNDTWDLDIQQTFPLPWRQHMVTGFGYRLISNRTETIPDDVTRFEPKDKYLHFINGFIQDEIELVPDNLKLILGSKFGFNDYSGFEIQPNARLVWKPLPSQTVWMAVSRGVRTPSIAEMALMGTVYDYPPVKTPPETLEDIGYRGELLGNKEFDSETMVAYEAGWRLMPFESLFLDIAGFINKYDNLRTFEPTGQSIDFSAYQVVTNYQSKNMQHGYTYGIELNASWNVTGWWKLSSAYSWINYNLDYNSGSDNLVASPSELSPRQQFSIRSMIDLPWNLELDSFMKYSDGIEGYNVPAFTRLDVRLGWSPAKWLDVTLMFENILDDQHAEFGGDNEVLVTTDVPRSFYGKITFKF